MWILPLKSNDKQEKSFWSVCDTQTDVFILASSLKFPSFTYGKILPVHPPIQLVAGIMTLREPYGRDKHEWGQRSGKRQAAEYLHNNDKKTIHPDD